MTMATVELKPEDYIEQGRGRFRFGQMGTLIRLDTGYCSECGRSGCRHVRMLLECGVITAEDAGLPGYIWIRPDLRQCDRCHEWIPVGEMSRDVDGVCLECVR